MQRLNPDDAAKVLILYFLRSLMKKERERLGIAQKDASFEAGWPAAAWGAAERGSRPLSKEPWLQVTDVLGLTTTDTVRHLNAFILENPSMWIETRDGYASAVCERPMTSPRVLRSGHTVSVDLDPIRPNLYHALSSFSDSSSEIIGAAVSLDLYAARAHSIQPSQGPSHAATDEERRMYIIRIIEEMPPEKLGLLERILDKFMRYPAKELAVAYRHFSLSVKNR